MIENELLREWTASGDERYLSRLLEKLYLLGEKKLSDKISKDVLHNSILKIYNRLEKKGDIRDIRSFFLKTLYNGVMDHYKSSKDMPLKDEMIETEEVLHYPSIDFDIERIRKLEILVREKQLGTSRIKYLHTSLIESDPGKISRQNRFFHRNELHKAISLIRLKDKLDDEALSLMSFGLLDMEQAGKLFTYELRVLKESEDDQQDQAVQYFFKQAVEYKRRALSLAQDSKGYSEKEQQLLVMLNMTIALHLFKQATEINPMFFKSRFSMGFCYYKLKRYEEAVKEFSASMFYLNQNTRQSNYEVKMGSTLRNLGIIYLTNLKQYHRALHSFQRGLEFTPTDEKIRLGLIFSACKLNDMEVALEHLRAFKRTDVRRTIEDWTAQDNAIRVIAIDVYKENEAVREFIPIEQII